LLLHPQTQGGETLKRSLGCLGLIIFLPVLGISVSFLVGLGSHHLGPGGVALGSLLVLILGGWLVRKESEAKAIAEGRPIVPFWPQWGSKPPAEEIPSEPRKIFGDLN